MATLLWVAAGGSLGAAARYLVSTALHGEGGFPWATLLVNAAGSLCIGFAWGAWAQQPWFQEWGRAFLAVGLLGGFTTFSAFSLEALTLAHSGRIALAAAYVLLSLVLCLAAAALGCRLGAG